MFETKAYFDGACGPVNPGGAGGWGFVVLRHAGQPAQHRVKSHGYLSAGPLMTNNVAEYQALLELLRFLRGEGLRADIMGDSLMVVNMVTGVWGRKKPHKDYPHLVPLLEEARELYRSGGHFMTWIPREQNVEADHESKLGLGIPRL